MARLYINNQKFKDLNIQQFKTTSNKFKQSKTIPNHLKLRNGNSHRNAAGIETKKL